jgi:nitroreductase
MEPLAETPLDSTLHVIYRRRAVRSYEPTPLAEDVVRDLLEAAVHAPTAMHAEPWAFVVVQDPAVLQRISDRAKALMIEEETEHRHLINAPGASPAGKHLSMLWDKSFNIFYNAGTLIVICAKPLGAFVTADCWLAAQTLMLAACAMELGTCPVGFAVPVLNTPEMKELLGIPAEMTAVAPIIAGHPRGVTVPVSRRPPEVLRWIRPSGA